MIDILAFGAHPDDVELGCGGTLAKEIAGGKTVGIIDLTRGELGTRGTAEIRDSEAAEAAKILGVSFRENLNMSDGFFVNDREHQMKIIEKIRQLLPERVQVRLSNAPRGCYAYVERIDEAHANAKRTWREMGQPEHLSAAELEHLQEASRVWKEPLACEYVNETLYFDIELPPQGVAAITVEFRPEPGGRGGLE